MLHQTQLVAFPQGHSTYLLLLGDRPLTIGGQQWVHSRIMSNTAARRIEARKP